MLRKFSILLVLSLIAVAFGVASLEAKSNLDKGKRYVDVRTNQVKTYSFNGRQPVTRDNVPEVLTPTSPTRDSRVSLGVPVTAGTNVDAAVQHKVRQHGVAWLPGLASLGCENEKAETGGAHQQRLQS